MFLFSKFLNLLIVLLMISTLGNRCEDLSLSHGSVDIVKDGSAIVGVGAQTLSIVVNIPRFEELLLTNHSLSLEELRDLKIMYNGMIRAELEGLNGVQESKLNQLKRTTISKRFVFTTAFLVITLGTLTAASIGATTMSAIAISKTGKLEDASDGFSKTLTSHESTMNKDREELNHFKNSLKDLTNVVNKMSEDLIKVENELSATKIVLLDLIFKINQVILELSKLRRGEFPTLLIDQSTRVFLKNFTRNNKVRLGLDMFPVERLIVDIEGMKFMFDTEVPIVDDAKIVDVFKVINAGVERGNVVFFLNVPPMVLSINGFLYDIIGECKKISMGPLLCENYYLAKSCLNNISSCTWRESSEADGFIHVGKDYLIARPKLPGGFVWSNGLRTVLAKGHAHKFHVQAGDIVSIDGRTLSTYSSIVSHISLDLDTPKVEEKQDSYKDELASILDDLKKHKDLEPIHNNFGLVRTNYLMYFFLTITCVLFLLISISIWIQRKRKTENSERMSQVEAGLALLLKHSRQSATE